MSPDTRPLRVLHVCPRPSFSGLEAYAFDLAFGQKALGCSVVMMVLRDSPLALKCRENQIATFEVNFAFTGKLKLIGSVVEHLFANEHRPEVVHLHSTQDLDLVLLPLFLLRGLSRHVRPRIILQTHIWISHSKRDPLHAISYALVDEVWCSSQPARETLKAYLPIAERKIRVVNYGRDVELMESHFLPRDQARSQLGLPQTATVVGTVARIDKGKGSRELLEGALLSMAKHPDLHLVMIGPPTADDPAAVHYASELKQRVHDLPEKLKQRVHLLGQVSDSYRLLKAFDLFALATYKECFALALLEALLAGLPSLATNSGGSPEVVRENQTGWLFAPESSEALHQALERALRSRQSWPRFSEAAAARVRSDFNFRTLLPTTLVNYRQLLAPRQKRN